MNSTKTVIYKCTVRNQIIIYNEVEYTNIKNTHYPINGETDRQTQTCTWYKASNKYHETSNELSVGKLHC